MGRSALILVMMLGVVFGIIGININSTNTSLVESQSGYYNYSFARNLARIGINRSLRACDKHLSDTTYHPPSSGLFNDGSYAIDFNKIDDTVKMISKGIYADTNYTMKVTLIRVVRPFPSINASIGVTAPFQTVKFSGKPTIDGTNHDINGNDIAGTAGDQPGIAVLGEDDAQKVKDAGGNIIGNPDIAVNPNQQDPKDYLNDYASVADKNYDLDHQPVNGECGTVNDPKVVVYDAGSDTSKTMNLTGNFEGSGILIIKGKIKIAGNFKWTGLIICSGEENVIDVTASGNFKVVGGMILSGQSANLTMNGSAGDVLYSSAAINNTAKKVEQLQFYDILEWYE